MYCNNYLRGLVIDSKKEIDDLFDTMKLSDERLNNSFKAMKINSQKGMIEKRGPLERRDQTESLDELDSFLNDLMFPFCRTLE